MRSERAILVVQRVGSTLWVMALAYLALAQPAHATVGSEPGEMLLRAVGAAVVATLFVTRKRLKHLGRLALAHVPHRRTSLAAMSMAVGDDPARHS
ncbi:MAG: hypothetical protein ACE5FL_11370 [Myxococcota bacterium]